MYYHDMQIALQEVPGQISICFSISGCQLKCPGCHSPFLWKEKYGEKLTQNIYLDILDRYKGLATCVLFMGGEWHTQKLSKYLNIAQKLGYKTCLYTGETSVSKCILDELTWIKTGRWDSDLGGLDSAKTNQKFIEVASNTPLNHLFLKTQKS